MVVLAVNLFPMRNILLAWLFFVTFSTNFFGINMVLVSGQCQTHQESLLLQMKKSLIFNSSLSVRLMQWSRGIDCCTWSGVECNVAGLVISLDWSEESISGGIENSTGLYGLQHLQSLNFAFNQFNASQIPSGLVNLTNLTYLNLSNAGFAGQIPFEISSMTRLVTLDLSSLSLLGSALLKLENPNLNMFVRNLPELRNLYLDDVNISAQGNEWCQALSSSLPNLQVLSLSSCFLSGPISPSLANLRSLTVIRLDNNNLSSPIPEFLADFPYLFSLSLSYCGLYGKIPEKIFHVPTLETLVLPSNKLLQVSLPEFPQNLALQTLILSETSFLGTIPDSIGNLKNLSRIELSSCNLNGSIPITMANLTRLAFLDLSINNLEGPIPSFVMSENLTLLDLSNNVLSGVISSTNWEQLLDLVHIDLSFNLLTGSIPTSLFVLPLLQQLYLDHNQFEGPVSEFANASSSVLNTLELSGNRLEGPIPMSIFELKNLNVLILSFNKFNGTVQLDTIQRLGNLTRLDLSYNSLVVNVSSSHSSFPPDISTLILASCKLSVIPDLKNQSMLFHLDLSENQISGEIPNWIWELGLDYLNLSGNLLVGLQEPYSIHELLVLDLHSNQLQGKILPPPPNVINLDYSSNNFNSSIPTDIGNYLSFNIVVFFLSNNNLTGFIPESICNTTYIRVLDLSNNSLSGTIPTCLVERSETLGVLNLKRNSLSGTISDRFPGNCLLQTLDLNGNQLEGTVPKSLANCKMLEVLDLGNNKINDGFPCLLKNVSSLHVLVLRSNKFNGNIHCLDYDVSWPMLQIIDLASNNLTGRLPRKGLTTWGPMLVDENKAQSKLGHLRYEIFGLSELYYQDAVTVTSKGLEMVLVKILTLFTSIDLSSNNFQGSIPEEMGLFKSLYVLNLSHNALTGQILPSVGNMRHLESLDLSQNSLSGEIPVQLANLNFLSVLNLSHNHLVGRIPTGTQLQSFSPTSFEDNDGLCGVPLTKSCTNSNESSIPAPSNQFDSSAPVSSNEFDWPFFLIIGVGFGTGFVAAVAPLIFSDKVDLWYDVIIHKFLRQFCM